MRIYAKIPGKLPIYMGFPTLLLFNGLSASLAAKWMKKLRISHMPKFEDWQVAAMMKAIRDHRLKHGRFTLIEAVTSEGEQIKISI